MPRKSGSAFQLHFIPYIHPSMAASLMKSVFYFWDGSSLVSPSLFIYFFFFSFLRAFIHFLVFLKHALMSQSSNLTSS